MSKSDKRKYTALLICFSLMLAFVFFITGCRPGKSTDEPIRKTPAEKPLTEALKTPETVTEYTPSSPYPLEKSPWSSFRGDPQNTGRSLFKGPAVDNIKGEVEIDWKFRAGHEIFSSPLISKTGIIYFGCDDSSVYGLTPDGKLLWKYKTGGYVSAPPILYKYLLIIGSNDQFLYAFDLNRIEKPEKESPEIKEESKETWKFKTGYYISSAPAAAGNRIIVTGEDHFAYCLDSSGRLIWKFETDDEIIGTPPLSPDGKKVYVPSKGGSLYALDVEKGVKDWVFEAGGGIIGSPLVTKEGSVGFGATDGNFYLISDKGKKLWTYETEGPIEGGPALAKDGTIYVGSKDSRLYALDKKGQLKWKYETGFSVESSPVIDSGGNIYFGSHDRCLHGVSSEGYRIFKVETEGAIVTSPAITPDGAVIFGSMDKYLYRVKKKTERKSTL